ncbi:MAG TPA: ketoacid-CoA transferase [Deltaproteobacteria bacterium]|nr:ketoacid-CoA transferase [Deltaproteobacteria bacterium]
MTPAEAVKRFIKDGSQLALGGFTVSRNPMALVYEIVRQGIKDLHLVCHSQGQSLDILIGAGSVRRVEIAYGANGRFASTCVRFRKAVERGEIEVEDYSNNQMSLRFLAGALGIPFVPTISGFQTDLLAKEGFPADIRGKGKVALHKFGVVKNPFKAEEEEEVLVVPALSPDVALVHAPYVGDDGTVRIKGLTFADIEEAKSADKVIVTCDEILPREFMRMEPDQNSLPSFLVDAIVPVPYGAHPTACPFLYDYDANHLNTYRERAREDDSFKSYLEEWVYDIENHEDYLEKIGGACLTAIRANSVMGYAPGLDRR